MSVASLALQTQRTFEYATDGTFAAMVLRRQTDLGAGLRMKASEMYPADQKTPTAPCLIAGGASGAAAGSSSTAMARDDAGRAERWKGIRRP